MQNNEVKILVVEDVEIARKMANLILTRLDCEVHLAETGHQALELINNNSYQLILLDLGLPDMDGITIAEAIRNNQNVKSATPIVALTAHSDEEIRQQCINAGIDDFLIKPLTFESASVLLKKFIADKVVVSKKRQSY